MKNTENFCEVESLFISLCTLSESDKTLHFCTVLTLAIVSNGFREPYLLRVNSSFLMRLSEPEGMFHLGQI